MESRIKEISERDVLNMNKEEKVSLVHKLEVD